LRLIFEADMARRVERYRQGELKDILAPRTEKHYKEIMDCFEEFLQNENTLLTDIRPDVVEKYRAERRKKLASNGGSVPGHIAVLHIVFRFAVDREIMPKNPINLKNETKPGENPKSPARPLAADELQSLRASG
jgi:site-specific recombinase XerD